MDTKRTVFVRSLLMMCLLLILPYARAQHPLTKELDSGRFLMYSSKVILSSLIFLELPR